MPTKEHVREVRRGAVLDTLLQDIRYAGRTLARSPGFTLAVTLTLAVGIGASTTVFTVVNGVLLRRLSVPDASRVVAVSESNGDRGLRRPSATTASADAWRTDARSMRPLAAHLPHNADVTGRGEPEEVVANDVSRDFFEVTGARPIIGRLFRPDEFVGESPDVVLIDEGYWRRSFGSDVKVLGTSLAIDGNPRTVVGVVLSGWPRGAALHLPMPDTYLQSRTINQRVLVVGRLAPGVRRDAALNELTMIATRVHADDPAPPSNWAVDVDPLLDSMVGGVRRALYVLLGAVGIVLLIVCANVSSMLVARAGARAHEIAIRTALGATRGRLARQLLVEGLLLTTVGSLLGLTVAVWGVAVVRREGPGSLPRLSEITIDARLLWFSVALTVVTGVLVALAPALRASGWQVHESLKASGRSTTHGRTSRSVLVVAEIAFATVLLAGAGLITRSLVNQMSIPLGFDPSGVVALDIDIPGGRYDRSRLATFVQQIEERLRAVPGVDGVGTSRAIPFESFGPTRLFHIEGRAPLDPREVGPGAFYTPATPGYLPAMRIALLRGRYLAPSDDRPEAPQVVVINEAMRRRFWGDADPIGSRLRLPAGIRAEVVGVMADVRQRQLTTDVSPTMWVPWSHAPDASMLVVIRTTGADPAPIIPSARRAIWSVDPLLPVEALMMSALYDQALAPARFNGWLFAGFAMIAVFLAALGVFALVSYSVVLRTREIGLRLALGAQAGQVQRMLVADGARLALGGLALGMAGACAVTRVMGSMLYEVPARDAASLGAAIVILGAVALLASWLPARRASQVPPIEALRRAE